MPRDTAKISYGSVESVTKLTAALKHQSAILASARQELMKVEDATMESLVPIMWLIQKSCGSVFFLAEKEQPLGVIVMARAVLEGTINALYILAAGSEASRKALRHAMQKSYRDITHIRNFQEEYLHENGPVLAALEPNDTLKEMIEEFSTKRGKELPYWTPESLHGRIDVVESEIGAQSAAMLRIAISAIYRHSSELLHGTLYGALYAMHQVPVARDIASADDIAVHNRQLISTVVFITICLLDQLVTTAVSGLPASGLGMDTRATVEAMGNEIFFE